MKLKIIFKQIFVKTGTLNIFDTIVYLITKIKFATQNKNFKIKHSEFVLPSDYYLYETYMLNYKGYYESGIIAAREILEWTSPYIKEPRRILEWGCGVSRVIRHLTEISPKGCEIYGADINDEMISWNKNNIKNITFEKTDYQPPLPFQENYFDLIYAFSVFTHIEVEFQEQWLKEISRITAPNGVFLFTTHGKSKEKNLTKKEKQILDERGSLTIKYKQKGHRLMGAFNRFETFSKQVEKYFEILEFYDNEIHPDKTGSQDLWIVRKKTGSENI